MKKMITAVAALLMSAATFAQPGESTAPANGAPHQKQQITPEMRAKRETDEMNTLVPLGSAYDKVLAINTDFHTKRMALRGGEKRGEVTPEQKQQMKELAEGHKKNLEAAMGRDLFVKYEAAAKAQRDERREMRQNAPPAGK